MKDVFNQIMSTIEPKIETIDLEGSDVSIEKAVEMIHCLEKALSDLRIHFLSHDSINEKEEILFFKELKPELLGLLLYFNKIYKIELKRPNGSNETQYEYYDNELKSLTFFFERNLDFYQYYRTKSSYFDEYYFIRGKACPKLCVDSYQFICDPQFSTGYDLKIAKIICNEMLRIFLNKKKHSLERQTVIEHNTPQIPQRLFKWTASKAAAVELGYALHAFLVFNNGNIDIKEIMMFFEVCFNIDLGDYYRTYIAIRSRKKDRTPFLNKLIESLINKMDKDDSRDRHKN